MLFNLIFYVSLKCQNKTILQNSIKSSSYESIKRLWKYNFSVLLHYLLSVQQGASKVWKFIWKERTLVSRQNSSGNWLAGSGHTLKLHKQYLRMSLLAMAKCGLKSLAQTAWRSECLAGHSSWSSWSPCEVWIFLPEKTKLVCLRPSWNMSQ